MQRALVCLMLLLSVSGCGVFLPYMYDAGKLEDRLAVSTPKEQVLKNFGKPDRVVQDDGQQAIWEYRLYPKGEWVGYLFHCPFFPNCFSRGACPTLLLGSTGKSAVHVGHA
jgi:hypothetical protein